MPARSHSRRRQRPRDPRLDLAGKLHQPWLAKQLESIANGAWTAGPVVVELDPTSFCDLACPECISSSLLQQGKFTSERLLELCDELVDAGVLAVILIGGGEPLIHPAIGEVIRRLAAGGISIGLTTNGTQIMRHVDVIAEHVTWTRVSVDAATRETYGLIRPHRGGRTVFDDVVRGMECLAARKRGELGYSFLLVTRRAADGTVRTTNVQDVLPAARLAREIGCDYFEVKPEYDQRHYLLAQPPEVLSRLRRDLVELETLETEGFSVVTPTTLGDVVDERARDQPKEYSHCPSTDLRTLLTPTGAYACPYHRGNPDARYGDPVTTSFAELWSGDQRQAKNVDPRVSCRFHCIRHESNLEILARAGGEREGDAHDHGAYDPFV